MLQSTHSCNWTSRKHICMSNAICSTMRTIVAFIHMNESLRHCGATDGSFKSIQALSGLYVFIWQFRGKKNKATGMKHRPVFVRAEGLGDGKAQCNARKLWEWWACIPTGTHTNLHMANAHGTVSHRDVSILEKLKDKGRTWQFF